MLSGDPVHPTLPTPDVDRSGASTRTSSGFTVLRETPRRSTTSRRRARSSRSRGAAARRRAPHPDGLHGRRRRRARWRALRARGVVFEDVRDAADRSTGSPTWASGAAAWFKDPRREPDRADPARSSPSDLAEGSARRGVGRSSGEPPSSGAIADPGVSASDVGRPAVSSRASPRLAEPDRDARIPYRSGSARARAHGRDAASTDETSPETVRRPRRRARHR